MRSVVGVVCSEVHYGAFWATDTGLADLKAYGISGDEIFEITAAAVGAALHSLEAGLRAQVGPRDNP
ncbi:hypothetical protein [Lentzea albidocapillata]|uniref:hypothetical protein n=1 Tax=Lentzea albidocapillata TaxID=40571 RepID=UPI000B7EFD94|nr:hypothetical protein [Lentzea albidocapillata]